MSSATGQVEFTAVSTNPAIDRVALIEGPAEGVRRASRMLETPGGKAIHAASVAAELGASSAVITTFGGAAGERLLSLLEAEPVIGRPVPVAGETRGTYTLVARDRGDLVEVHEPSSPLTAEECDRLVEELASSRPASRVVAVCGSLPPDSPPDLHARLVETARDAGSTTILDCSTPEALAAGIGAGPDLVAPNLVEAANLLGTELDLDSPDADLAEATAAIRALGAKAVWLTLGERGSLLDDGEAISSISAPAPAQAVNAVGCGDALIGGLAAGLLAGRDLGGAAALGAAAAADKLSHLHPGRVERAGVEAIAAQVEVSRSAAGSRNEGVRP